MRHENGCSVILLQKSNQPLPHALAPPRHHKSASACFIHNPNRVAFSQHCVCFWKSSMVRLAVNAGMDLNLPQAAHE